MFGLKKKQTEKFNKITNREDLWRCLDKDDVDIGGVVGSDKEEAIINYVNAAIGVSCFDRPVCTLVRDNIRLDVAKFVNFIRNDHNGPLFGALNIKEKEIRKRFNLPSQSTKEEPKEATPEQMAQNEQLEKQIADVVIMGVKLIYLGKYEEAINGYDMVLEIDSENVGALNNKGIALGGLGRHDEAISYMYKALEIEPKSVHVLNSLSGAFFEHGQYEKSMKYSDISLDIEPKNSIAISNKGLALDELGRHDEAIENFDKVLEIDPTHFVTLNAKGRALENQKKLEDAITWFDKALEIYPKNAAALTNKKRLLEKIGKS